jgi:hypothetical protein
VSKSKVTHIMTKESTRIVIRNRAGKKLFEMVLPGACITVRVPSAAAIEVEPKHEEAH